VHFPPQRTSSIARPRYRALQPPATYVTAREFVAIEKTSVVHATVTLPDGGKQEIPRAGIVAIIDYPPNLTTGAFAKDAATAIQSIQALGSKYPEYSGKLNKALAAWTAALTGFQLQARQSAETTRPKTTPRGISLEIDGVKYADATLASFDGAFVGIEHSAGIERIPAIKLKPEQIAALNGTMSSVRIDPAQINQQPPANTAPRSGNTRTNTSPVTAVAPPAETIEIARLKEAVSTSEAPFKKLKAEESDLRKRMESTPKGSKDGPEYMQMWWRSIAVNNELRDVENRYEQAVERLHNAEEAANSKVQTAKTEGYRTAATLPLNSSDWDAIVQSWKDEVIEQAKAAAAADKTFLQGRGRPDSRQLLQIRDTEQKKLQIAKATLSQAEQRARDAALEKERVARNESDQMQTEKSSEDRRIFKNLAINNELMIAPPVVSKSSPSYAETIEFLHGKFGLRIGFGETSRKLIFRERDDMTYTFDPKDINPEVTIVTNVNAFGVGRGPVMIVLSCRNAQRKIELFRAYGEPTMISEIQVYVRDSVEADKLSKALSHLVTILGATKEAF
jgi:hypothetical protein